MSENIERPKTDIAMYLSSSMDNAEMMQEFAKKLRTHQVIVSSTWHAETTRWTPGDVEGARGIATRCLTEIIEADWFVQFSDAPSTLGGMHYEMGFALGLRKLIILIGNATMPFHYLPCVKYCKTTDEFMFGLMAARVRHDMQKGNRLLGRPRR